MLVRTTVHYPARGITSTIAIAIGHVYNVIYEGAIEENDTFFLFVLKF